MTFEDYIISIVGEDSVLSVDGEMIDEADDYKILINDLFELSKGELKLESFRAEENGEEASIEIKVSGTIHELVLEISGWINEDFIVEINRVLKEKGSENKFNQFWANDSFGQEVGFFFAGKTLSDQVYDYANKKNEKVTDYGLLYQITDGEREEGYEDL